MLVGPCWWARATGPVLVDLRWPLCVFPLCVYSPGRHGRSVRPGEQALPSGLGSVFLAYGCVFLAYGCGAASDSSNQVTALEASRQ